MFLITFEGVECSGKTVQSQKLFEYCQHHNIPAILVREPGATSLGENLRDILLSQTCSPLTEFLIFSASRSELVQTVILPNLEQNIIVISDRYFHSSLAYQGYGRNLDLSLLKQISYAATSNLHPKKTFLLNPTYSTFTERLQAKKQIGLDRIEQETEQFHKRVYQGFIDLVPEYDYISVLDGDLSPEEIHQQIISQLNIIDSRFL